MAAVLEIPYERVRRFLVRDAMTADVVVARRVDTLLNAARVMRDRKVSGVPVVGPNGAVVGILSERDIVERLRVSAGVVQYRGILDLVVEAADGRMDRLQRCVRTLKATKVGEAMTRRPITIEPDEPLSEAARLLHQSEIHRVPVVDDGRLVGILTREDLLRIAGTSGRRAAGAKTPAR